MSSWQLLNPGEDDIPAALLRSGPVDDVELELCLGTAFYRCTSTAQSPPYRMTLSMQLIARVEFLTADDGAPLYSIVPSSSPVFREVFELPPSQDVPGSYAVSEQSMRVFASGFLGRAEHWASAELTPDNGAHESPSTGRRSP